MRISRVLYGEREEAWSLYKMVEQFWVKSGFKKNILKLKSAFYVNYCLRDAVKKVIFLSDLLLRGEGVKARPLRKKRLSLKLAL